MSGFISNPTQVLAAGDITSTSTTGDHIFKTDDPATNKFVIESDGQIVMGTSATAASGALVTVDGWIALQEQASVPTGAPHADNYGRLYAKNDDQLYYLDDAGLETQLTTPGGGPPVGAGWSDLGADIILTTASDRVGIGAQGAVTDKLLVRGLTSDSTTNVLILEAQDGTDLFSVRADGLISTGGVPTFGSGNVFVDTETVAGIKNGVNTAFTIANTPLVGSVHLFLNGLLQTESSDFTILGANITMNVAPQSDDILIASYRK